MAQIKTKMQKCEFHPPYLVRMCKHIRRLEQNINVKCLANSQHGLALIQKEGPSMRQIQRKAY